MFYNALILTCLMAFNIARPSEVVVAIVNLCRGCTLLASIPATKRLITVTGSYPNADARASHANMYMVYE